MNLIASLDSMTDAGAWRFGAKAATLAKLARRGFPVPQGFAIANHVLEDLVMGQGLGIRRGALLETVSETGLDRVAAALRELVLTLEPSQMLEASIRAMPLVTSGRPLAIRSSSSIEDGADHAFAGLHDSFLDVTGPDQCLEAIRQVWASLYAKRVLAMLHRYHISPHGIRMAVLVQEMIEPRWAGVGLSVHPTRPSTETLVLYAVRGRGVGCVDGSRASEEVPVHRSAHTVPGDRDREIGMESGTARSVADLLIRTETALDRGPLDIEWAVDEGGEPFLLQARPMTAKGGNEGLQWKSPVPGAHWRRRWRLGEWLRDPVTPLFADWAVPRLVAGRERCGGHKLGLSRLDTFAMPAPWYCLVHGYFYARQDLPEDVGANMPLDKRLARMRRLRDEVPPSLDSCLPAYRESITRRCALEIETMPATDVIGLIDELLDEAAELWYAIAPLGYGFETMVFEPRYECLLAGTSHPPSSALFRGFPNESVDAQQALVDLSKRIAGEPATVRALTDPRALPQWLEEALETYHATYGHRVTCLDFINPILGEQPERTLAALRALIAHEVTPPRERLARVAEHRERATDRARGLLGKCGAEGEALIELMGCLQANARVREQVISAFQWSWPLLRRAVLSLGDRLTRRGVIDEGEDIFFLERDEVVDTIECGAPVGDLMDPVRGRRLTWTRRRTLVPPETIPIGTENPQITHRCGYVEDENGCYLVGQGVSAGCFRGPVRVVTDTVTEIGKDEVLVTDHADPGLTPLMILAGALVVDIGGGASHSSMVARELGLPTVVNTLEATARLRDGQWVEVCGDEGTVRILD